MAYGIWHREGMGMGLIVVVYGIWHREVYDIPPGVREDNPMGLIGIEVGLIGVFHIERVVLIHI
jgi:hypothetical protein